MKHAPHLYARALAELIAEGKHKNIEENFLALLKKNRDLKHLPKIIQLAERNLVAQDGGREVVVETAHPVSDIKKKIHALLKPHDIVREETNPELLSGMRITINGERQIDGSLKTQLDQLFGTHRI
jgi:F0F1-type ATP synthase delta subunit